MNEQFIDEVMGLIQILCGKSYAAGVAEMHDRAYASNKLDGEITQAEQSIRAKLREGVMEPVDKEESNHSGEATGKTYEFRTMQDVLNLTPEEFKRMLPDLATWHEITRESSILLDIPVNELNAVMVWTDDGSLDVTGVEVNLGEYGSFDLLKIANNIGAK